MDKKFLYFFFLILLPGFTLKSCSKANNSKEETAEKPLQENECPKRHFDSIVPILYGFPSEEMFAKADSGLVVLGGCELPEKPKKYYCKKHQIEF